MLPALGMTLQKRRKTAAGEQGFTLIELIVVSALIGIMLSITIPSLRNTFFTDPLKSTTRKVIGLVGGVRELAVRYQQPYLLHISQAENRIWYEKDGIDESDESEEEEDRKEQVKFPETVRISGIWLAGNDEVSGELTEVWVSKKGYMNHTVIRIEDDEGNDLYVHFYPFLDGAEVTDKVASL